MEKPHIDVIVIGAGVVGFSCALALQKRGFSVKIIERKGVASEASFGNAGAFAFSEILPLAQPGMIWKAPKWLLDPMGPLSIPPSYGLKVLPWMLRFLHASVSNTFDKSVEAQASLMKFCEGHLESHIRDVGAEDMLSHEGQIQLYESDRHWQAEKKCWEIWQRHGIDFQLLHGVDEISKYQPGISSRFKYGVFTPAWRRISDPFVYTTHLASIFVQRGGIVEYDNVTGLENLGSHVRVECNLKDRMAKYVVVAAGSWSHILARMIGEEIPLETERGYNTTLPAGAFDLKTHITFPEHGFVVSKIGEGVRVGGAVELAGHKLPPNYKRSEFMLAKAKLFLPDLDDSNGKQWMGFRPSMPDSLPVIGRSKTANNIIYAFGHGHLGLTQSAGTGELVAQLISGSKQSVDLGYFNSNRF